MTNEQLLLLSQMATELYNARLDVDALKKVRNDEEAKRVAAEGKLSELAFVRQSAEANKEMLEKAWKDLEAVKAERDAAQHRLFEVVEFMETVWTDYKCVRWKTKEMKERAKRMADKMKEFVDGLNVHAEICDGKWVAK